ncbi:hypothetical protein F4X88_20425 [Candidatus Poribacteria bacterium]|nr:hypothetical protein [Candidatus Poribacteria bacterium]
MIMYEQWNKAIISYFFEDCEPNEIVFLQTDANTLLEIAEKSKFSVADPDEAADSLTEAVRTKVVYSNSVILSKINPTQANLWRDSTEEEPSQVAFLALTVLAASLMGSEVSVASSNYYVRLNKLLFGRSIEGAPQGFDRPQFEDFWKQFRGWLRNYYDVELYLTEGSSTRRYVWYPISQCLISKGDRRIVYRFFRDHQLTPFSEIPDNQLERDLRVWLPSPTGSPRLARYFSREPYRNLIVSQVQSLLKYWNGESEIAPDQSQGQSQPTYSLINVELRFKQFDNIEIRYWFRRRGRGDIECRTNPFGISHLQVFSSDQWFRPEVIDDNSLFWNLSDRSQLQTDETNPIIYALNPSDVWVFREDSKRDDGWLSQRNMQLYKNHLVVFHSGLRERVIDCLRQICEREFKEPSPIYVDGKEHDWLYLQVEPTQRVSFSDEDTWRLSVNSNERISFIGGLPVNNQHGRKAYLDFCLPTIFVPDLGLPDEEFLSVGDQIFPIREDRLVSLDNKLEPGTYLLNYGGQTRELLIISPERSSEQHEQTLTDAIAEDPRTMPTYGEKKISEISEKPGIWLTGAKFFGTSIPEVTWDDVRIEPRVKERDERQSPASLISSIVKLAIELKSDQVSIPNWLSEAIKYIDQNVAMRSLVEKKLQQYHETALSYADLHKRGGG